MLLIKNTGTFKFIIILSMTHPYHGSSGIILFAYRIVLCPYSVSEWYNVVGFNGVYFTWWWILRGLCICLMMVQHTWWSDNFLDYEDRSYRLCSIYTSIMSHARSDMCIGQYLLPCHCCSVSNMYKFYVSDHAF